MKWYSDKNEFNPKHRYSKTLFLCAARKGMSICNWNAFSFTMYLERGFLCFFFLGFLLVKYGMTRVKCGIHGWKNGERKRDRVWWWHIWNLFHCHISLNWFRFGNVRVKCCVATFACLVFEWRAKNDKIKTLERGKNRAKMRNNIKISKPGILTAIANNSNSE